jgi:ubiquinone/menaquinone biosynthesis C-methylase UbiE
MERSDSPPTELGSLTAVEAWRRYDDDERRLSAHVSERMLDLAGLRPGSRMLDIAMGRGEPALRAATRVAPGGFVLGTDISDDMLDFARERATAESVTNLTIRVTDGETLTGVPEQAFDAALCRWGLMYFDGPRRALESTRRCLRPGGTVVAAVWTAPAYVSRWSMPRGVLARHVPTVFRIEVWSSGIEPAGTRNTVPAAIRGDTSNVGTRGPKRLKSNPNSPIEASGGTAFVGGAT